MASSVNREVIRARLAALTKAGSGVLQPEDVLKDAEPKGSPLHDEFEWDNKKAGHAYRLEQARRMIREVRVVVTTTTSQIETVAYVRDPDADPGKQGYRQVVELRGDANGARAALIVEFQRARSALERARSLAVAFDLQSQIDDLLQAVDTTRRKLNPDNPTATT